MKPIIVINLKTYKESIGDKALKFAKISEKFLDNLEIIITVQAADSYIAKKTKTKIYSQHTDPFEPGRNTGHIIIEDLQAHNIKGTLLNHSEHQLDFETLTKTIERCKQNNFKTIICANSVEYAEKILKLNPDMIAFEIPELISTGKAISEYQPDSVKKFSEIIKMYNKKENKKILALCGAGISTAEDIKSARELGCDGVLIASAFVQSKNPENFLREVKKSTT